MVTDAVTEHIAMELSDLVKVVGKEPATHAEILCRAEWCASRIIIGTWCTVLSICSGLPYRSHSGLLAYDIRAPRAKRQKTGFSLFHVTWPG